MLVLIAKYGVPELSKRIHVGWSWWGPVQLPIQPLLNHQQRSQAEQQKAAAQICWAAAGSVEVLEVCWPS